VCCLRIQAKKTGAQSAGFSVQEEGITSFLLSSLQQRVLQGRQALRQQQVPPVRAQQQQVLQEPLVLAALLSCRRQQVPKRSGRRRGFAWS